MALLVGIIRGSAVALTASLTMSAIVFLLLPEYSARLASGRLPLLKGLLWAWSLTAVASASFSGELQRRAALAPLAPLALWHAGGPGGDAGRAGMDLRYGPRSGASPSTPDVAVRAAEPAVVGIKAPTALAHTDARADQLQFDRLEHLMQARRRRYGRIATFDLARF